MNLLSEYEATLVSGGVSALGVIGAVAGAAAGGFLTQNPVGAIAGGAAGYVGGEMLNQAVDDALSPPPT